MHHIPVLVQYLDQKGHTVLDMSHLWDCYKTEEQQQEMVHVMCETLFISMTAQLALQKDGRGLLAVL